MSDATDNSVKPLDDRENWEMTSQLPRHLNEMIHQELNGSGTCTRKPYSAFSGKAAATACRRWAAEGTVNFDRLILWPGLISHPDIDFSSGRKNPARSRNHPGRVGDQDPFLTTQQRNRSSLMHWLNQPIWPVHLLPVHT